MISFYLNIANEQKKKKAQKDGRGTGDLIFPSIKITSFCSQDSFAKVSALETATKALKDGQHCIGDHNSSTYLTLTQTAV